MRYYVPILLLLLTAASFPESSACQEQFPDLPALASRLGVEKITSTRVVPVALAMCNGDSYDLFELVNKALDRLEKQP